MFKRTVPPLSLWTSYKYAPQARALRDLQVRQDAHRDQQEEGVQRDHAEGQGMYRVTIHVVPSLLLTSKQKFRFNMRSIC